MNRPLNRKPPVPTAHDLKLWRALVDKALKAARRPDQDPLPLMRAADRCQKAVLPIGHQLRDSVFVQLMAFGRMWWRLAPGQVVGGRINRAEELAALAGRCRDVLELPDPASGARFRADIDG